MLTIALDAMGGDHAPKAEVEGAIRAARDLGVKVILVGQQDVVRRELELQNGHSDLPIEVVHASERVTMEDNAAKAFRTKRDSSIRVGSRMVRDGLAQGFVSAGNTGAVMATAKIVQGVVPGVDRPALVGILPTAVMAEIYSRVILRQPNPRVGLLSIGEEEHKGNELTHAATPVFKGLNLNFVGNVEGSDLYSGAVDVVVCDGFVGNVALKVSEGLGDMVKHLLRDALESTISGKIGYAISKNAFATFKKRLDYSEYGGAPLLGVRGVCIICHGRSNANAIKNAIRVAAEFSGGKINQRIEDELRGTPVPVGE
jgi:glycerol-3-phosphate acyltransferase PlsX